MLIVTALSKFSARLVNYFSPRPILPIMAETDRRVPKLEATGSDSAWLPVDQWTGNVLTDDFLTQRRDYGLFVTQIKWFKNRHGLQHEYLVATVFKEGDDADPIYLRFERRSTAQQVEENKEKTVFSEEEYEEMTNNQRKEVEEACKSELHYVKSKNSLYAGSSSQSVKNYLNKPTKPADDMFRVRSPHQLKTGKTAEPSELLAVYVFEERFALRDLALTVKCISHAENVYRSLETQCYWFARTVIQTAAAIFPAKIQILPEYSRAGMFTLKFLKKVVNIDNPEEIEKFRIQILDMIQKNNAAIQENYDRGEGGRLKAEALVVEKTAALEEETERRRQAEEMRRQAEEMRQAEAEKRRQAEEKNAELLAMIQQLALQAGLPTPPAVSGALLAAATATAAAEPTTSS